MKSQSPLFPWGWGPWLQMTSALKCIKVADNKEMHKTPRPLYNTIRFNTVLDIIRISVGPQINI